MASINFSVFENSNKREDSNDPDFRLNKNLGDKDSKDWARAAALWVREDKKGRQYFSINIDTKDLARVLRSYDGCKVDEKVLKKLEAI